MNIKPSSIFNFVCISPLGPKTKAIEGVVSQAKGDLANYAKEYKGANYAIEFSDNSKSPSNIGFLTVTNKVNNSSITFNLNDLQETKMNMLKIIAHEESDLYFDNDAQRKDFETIIKSFVTLLHKISDSTLSYATSIEAIKHNLSAAIECGLGANYAIIKQPETSEQPGLAISSIDDSNIELMRKDHPLKVGLDYSYDNLKDEQLEAQGRYQKNVFSALMGLAA